MLLSVRWPVRLQHLLLPADPPIRGQSWVQLQLLESALIYVSVGVCWQHCG